MIGYWDETDRKGILLCGKKAQIRAAIAMPRIKGERLIRSVQKENGREYVNILDASNIDELHIIINEHNAQIEKRSKIVKKLERVGRWMQGQITLEEVFGEEIR